MPTSMPSLRACISMVWVAQRNRSLSSGQLLLKNGHSKWGMMMVMCCQSQSALLDALALQALALDLQLWQGKRESKQSGEAQQ